MNYAEVQEQSQRLQRTEDALEARRQRLYNHFYPLLGAWVGKHNAPGAGIREIKISDKHVEIVYGYVHRYEKSQDYSVILSREVCESPNAVAEVEALKKLENRKAEDASRAQRIADLQRELQHLGGTNGS